MKYLGMNSSTGRALTDNAHIHQSIRDILLTPIGSRVMRREYGSMLYDLIDQPKNKALRLKIMSACYMALAQWEPRVRLQSIDYENTGGGEMHVKLSGVISGTSQSINFSVPVPAR